MHVRVFYMRLLHLILIFFFPPELSTLAWLTGMEHEKNSQIHPNPRPIPNSIPTLATRSETGMVGLVNLGNTCYMNSVIQALYMSSL